MSDLLDTLMALVTDVTTPSRLRARISILANWFYADCKARNLSARTIEFYQCKLAYLIIGLDLVESLSARYRCAFMLQACLGGLSPNRC
jgi:hypothetical protein